MLGDVFWERKLDEDAVYGGVIVELGELLEELRLTGVFGEGDELAFDVGLEPCGQH